MSDSTQTKLHRLFAEQGQSPWLDNLWRGYLTGGDLVRLVESGVRGITSNPTIFEKAITGHADYDEQFAALVARHEAVEDAYWDLVADDIEHALEILQPLYDDSGGGDGFVSLELDPGLAHDTPGSVAGARSLVERIDRPNLMVKIPATEEGIPAVNRMIAEGNSINITLIFSIERYSQVIEAYLAGLESCQGDLSGIHSVASFFVSRVDTEVDRRLDALQVPAASALKGRAAVAQAKLAYEMFIDRFSGPRWDALAARGAHRQRPLWASTSTKNPAYPDTLYVDSLIGPHTVNTLPEATIAAFEDRGTVARTVDVDVDLAHAAMEQLVEVGVDMADVGRVLEEQGVDSFARSFDDLMGALQAKAAALGKK